MLEGELPGLFLSREKYYNAKKKKKKITNKKTEWNQEREKVMEKRKRAARR